MKINTVKLPRSSAALEKIIFDLTARLENQQKIIDQSKTELSLYKEKYARLIEEIRLAKNSAFLLHQKKIFCNPIFLMKLALSCRKK